jgi:molecular chaperone GrpE
MSTDRKKNKILLVNEEYHALKDKAKKADEYFERMLRLQADFDNYKKRLEKEKIEFIKFANEEIIVEILKILDDFERAVEAGKSKHDFDVLYKGIEMIHKDLKEFLKQRGVEEIESKGKPFNPHEHEAMMQEETDAHPEDHVVEELQKGYMLNGRVIRPAKVKVAKKPEK